MGRVNARSNSPQDNGLSLLAGHDIVEFGNVFDETSGDKAGTAVVLRHAIALGGVHGPTNHKTVPSVLSREDDG